MVRCVFIGLVLIAGCANAGVKRTAVLVTVDADAQIKRRATGVQVTIRGGTGGHGQWLQTYDRALEPVVWPFDFHLTPRGRDGKRGFEVLIAVSDDDGEFAKIRAISSYVSGKVIALPLLLENGCVGVFCESDETCTVVDGTGGCQDARIAADNLPPIVVVMDEDGGPSLDAAINTQDAGTPIQDGGSERGSADSSDSSDGESDSGSGADSEADSGTGPETGTPPCGNAGDCSDDDPCTNDSCGNDGVCFWQPSSGASCDDGDACTGDDMCQGGECEGVDSCFADTPLVPLTAGEAWCGAGAVYQWPTATVENGQCNEDPRASDENWCSRTQGHFCANGPWWQPVRVAIPPAGELKFYSLSTDCSSASVRLSLVTWSAALGTQPIESAVLLYRDDCTSVEISEPTTICTDGDARFAIGRAPGQNYDGDPMPQLSTEVPSPDACDIVL